MRIEQWNKWTLNNAPGAPLRSGPNTPRLKGIFDAHTSGTFRQQINVTPDLAPGNCRLHIPIT